MKKSFGLMEVGAGAAILLSASCGTFKLNNGSTDPAIDAIKTTTDLSCVVSGHKYTEAVQGIDAHSPQCSFEAGRLVLKYQRPDRGSVEQACLFIANESVTTGGVSSTVELCGSADIRQPDSITIGG